MLLRAPSPYDELSSRQEPIVRCAVTRLRRGRRPSRRRQAVTSRAATIAGARRACRCPVWDGGGARRPVARGHRRARSRTRATRVRTRRQLGSQSRRRAARQKRRAGRRPRAVGPAAAVARRQQASSTDCRPPAGSWARQAFRLAGNPTRVTPPRRRAPTKPPRQWVLATSPGR